MMKTRVVCILLICATFITSTSADISTPKGPTPDVQEMAEAALAPFTAFDGGGLYITKTRSGRSSVCGRRAAATSRMAFPVTLSDLDRLYGTLPMTNVNQTFTAEQAELDVEEGCYLVSENEDWLCAAWLMSDPTECSMNITDSIAYWTFRQNTQAPPLSSEVREGGADVFVEGVLRLRGLRDQLRRSIKQSQESAKAGKELWRIILRGWNATDTSEDQRAFVRAVSERGAAIVRGAYPEIMNKWTLVKRWVNASLAQVQGNVTTFSTKNGGKLLSSQSYCALSTDIDDWLTFFDTSRFGYHVSSKIKEDTLTFFRGKKKISQSGKL